LPASHPSQIAPSGDLTEIFLETNSTSWGLPEVAAARALIETINENNEAMMRTYHPSLAHLDAVQVITELVTKKDIWIVYDASKSDTHAGGREIHIIPTQSISPTTWFVRGVPDMIPRNINPRQFLSSNDLEVLRAQYPTAIGARVLISGFLVLLYKSRDQIRKAWDCDGIGGTFGMLRVQYDVARGMPTHHVHSGASVARLPHERQLSGSDRPKTQAQGWH
jgi:hypothetical protein